MDYAAIETMRDKHPAWRMLRADQAPLLLSFLGRFFVDESRGASPAGQIIDALDDELYALNSGSPNALPHPRPAADYLADWAAPEYGYLRRFYPLGSDEIHYDATPALEKAYAWVQSLRSREFRARIRWPARPRPVVAAGRRSCPGRWPGSGGRASTGVSAPARSTPGRRRRRPAQLRTAAKGAAPPGQRPGPVRRRARTRRSD